MPTHRRGSMRGFRWPRGWMITFKPPSSSSFGCRGLKMQRCSLAQSVVPMPMPTMAVVVKRTTCIKGHTQHQAVQRGAKQPHLSRRASRAAGGGVHKVLLAQPLQRPWQLRYGHHAGLL